MYILKIHKFILISIVFCLVHLNETLSCSMYF